MKGRNWLYPLFDIEMCTQTASICLCVVLVKSGPSIYLGKLKGVILVIF